MDMASTSSSVASCAIARAKIVSRSSIARSRIVLRCEGGKSNALGLQVSFSTRRWDSIGCGRGRRRMRGIAALADAEREEGSSIAMEEEIEEKGSDDSKVSMEEPAGESVARVLTPEEEEDQECVDQILRILELLKINRDMTPNEVRLIVMIEDPREAESLGVLTEDGEWTSYRDEMGNALIDISEGRIPDDRELLRALRKELLSWPNLEEMADKRDPRQSSYAQITDTGLDPVFSGERAKVGWDEAAEIVPGKEKDVSEKLPPAFGYSLLYLVSLLPILIGVAVVAILFINSFQ